MSWCLGCSNWVYPTDKTKHRQQSTTGVLHSTVPQRGTVCQLLCVTTACRWTFSISGSTVLFLDSNLMPSGAVLEFLRFCTTYECSEWLAYLLIPWQPHTVHTADKQTFFCVLLSSKLISRKWKLLSTCDTNIRTTILLLNTAGEVSSRLSNYTNYTTSVLTEDYNTALSLLKMQLKVLF